MLLLLLWLLGSDSFACHFENYKWAGDNFRKCQLDIKHHFSVKLFEKLPWILKLCSSCFFLFMLIFSTREKWTFHFFAFVLWEKKKQISLNGAAPSCYFFFVYSIIKTKQKAHHKLYKVKICKKKAITFKNRHDDATKSSLYTFEW